MESGDRPARSARNRQRSRGLSIVGKLALLARVWLTAARVQLALWRHPLPEVVAALARPGGRPPVSVPRLSRAVSRGLRIGPWMPRCLLRSLVLFRLLREQGDLAYVAIGLPERPRSADAHAWVELEGFDVGPAPGRKGHQALARYPRETTAEPATGMPAPLD